jgi:glucosylceramidase
LIAPPRFHAATVTRAFVVALLAAACARDPIVPPLTCPAGQAGCGEGCIDVTADTANCGGCGIPCSTGHACVAGVCQCTAGLVDCNGRCVVSGGADCGAAAETPALVTSAPGAYWKTDATLTPVTGGKVDVAVDDTATAQIWEGFGGAFNEIGWNVLSMLSDSDRDAAIRLLYGADGARFAFGRIPIGASDYAMDRYTHDETAGDTALASFSIDRDMQKLIPYVKAAQAVKGNVRFWASPWTPPTWMKQGPFSSGNVASPFDGGTMKSDDATLAAFAQYLVKFVQAYAEQGITVEAVAPQNEPNYTGNYPTCAWSPATYTKLIGQHLGPAIASAGLGTKIMLGTLNGGGSDGSIYSSVMGDAVARAYVDVLGFQWGMVSSVAGARRYNLPIWQSEHRCGNYPWVTPFDADAAPNDHAYAVESWGLIRDWIRAGATAYSAWNMVLDTVGVGIDTTRVWPQNALLTVDTLTRTLNVTPTYYVFRHLSQFVATGAKVVATKGGDAVAFKNPDGSIVAVIRNAGGAKTITVAAAGKQVQLAIPADGWATVVSR